MIKIKTAKIFTKNRKANTRIIVNEGSSRSAKTYSIIQLLIGIALQSRIRITGCRARLTWLKATAYLDFLDILQNQFGLYNPKDMNKTELIYTFPNGTQIYQGTISGQQAGSTVNFTVTVVDQYGYSDVSGYRSYLVIGEETPWTMIIGLIGAIAAVSIGAAGVVTRMRAKGKKNEYIAEELLPLPI